MSRVRLVAFLFTLISISLFVPASPAQVTTVNDTTSTPIQGAGHDYIHLLSETVNPANGSVSVSIQLPMPKGRGITVPFSIAYSSNGLNHLVPGVANPGRASWASNVDSFAAGGWNYVYPTLRADSWVAEIPILTGENNGQPIYTNYPCSYTSNYLFQDATGGLHSLGLGASFSSDPPPQGCNATPVASGAGGDAQIYATLVPVTGGTFQTLPVSVFDKSGTLYYFGSLPGGGFPTSSTMSGLPTYIEDRNGNRVTTTQNKNTSFSFTDTLGRTAISVNGFGPSGTTNTVLAGGLSYQVTWKTVTGSYTVPSNPITNVSSFCQFPGAEAVSYVVISQITLPNGQSFHFYYGSDNPDPNFQNQYGLLSEIDYPSGGWVKYKWRLSDSMNELAVYTGGEPNGQGGVNPVQDGCIYQYTTPVIGTREVGFGGSSSPSQTQTFSNYTTTWASGGSSWTGKSVQVTTVDNVRSLSALTTYSYLPITVAIQPFEGTNFPAQMPLENVTSYYNWGNTSSPTRSVAKTWASPFDLLSQKTTLLDVTPNLTSQITYSYTNAGSSSLSQVHEVDEYDFGLSSPSRSTVTNYQSFSSTPGIIADSPCQTITYNGTPTGTRVAESDSYYDGTTGLCSTISSVAATGGPSGFTGRDDTTFGPSSTVPRGNPTKISKLCIQSAPACTSGSSTTTRTYDETGQVLTSTDPCGNGTCTDMPSPPSHTTSYLYADSYTTISGGLNTSYTPSGSTNAYLTKITDPLTHTENFTYDFNNGQLTISKDQNSQTTTYLYNDPFNRPGKVNYPDGGLTTISYNDSPYNPSTPSPSVTVSKAMSSSTNLVTVTASDGLGHAVKALLTSDPDCASGDRTDTTYDGMGHVYTVSNPYCTTGDPTYGLTTYSYDVLGRTTQVAHPDGTSAYISYTGSATETTDEGNGTQAVQRISQTDALGRLTSVCEVATAPFVGTGGLSSSSLIGQSGTPASCGLLISGSGFLTTYQYDPLDNLLQVNQATMTARTFTYDSLSRLLTASNPESGSVSYTYDANGNLFTKTSPLPNQTGSSTVTTTYQYDVLNRLTKKSYSDGTTPFAYFNYDNTQANSNGIGRLSQSGTANGWSLNYNSYDLMGRITSKSSWLQNPNQFINGGVGITYTYDLLGNLTQDPAGYWATNYTYNAAARLVAVTSMFSDPNNPAAVESGMHYNALGLLTSDTLGDGETESYSYDKRGRLLSQVANLGSSNIYSLTIPSSGGYAANSDILAANDSINGNWTYTYDAFNRLVGSNKNSGQSVFSYVYDRFGNRWQQNGPYSMQLAFTGNNSTNNNRMDGYSYDAAGNLLYDGTHHYFYDAENRLINVDNGSTATYVYNADGQRVQKLSPGINYQFYYDLSGRFIKRFDGNQSGNFSQGNFYAGSRHVATIGGGTFFSHSDWLGTERVRTAYNSGICESTTSLPFGDSMITSGACYNDSPLHFTGKERDSESGLDNFGARFNSSNFGRFLSPDPMLNSGRPWDPQTWNRYAYARNNPLNRVDPDGLYDWGAPCKQNDDLCEKNRQAFRDALKRLEQARDSYKPGSKEYKKLAAARGAYGTEDDHNKIFIAFGSGGEAPGRTHPNDDGSFTITFDAKTYQLQNQRDQGVEYAADVAHEGTHINWDKLYLAGMVPPGLYQKYFVMERIGYEAQSLVNRAAGLDSPVGIWNTSWAEIDQHLKEYATALNNKAAEGAARDCRQDGRCNQ